jgi:hypothetical protein
MEIILLILEYMNDLWYVKKKRYFSVTISYESLSLFVC